MEKQLSALELEKIAKEFEYDWTKVNNKKRSLQSAKTNLNKKKFSMPAKQYEAELNRLVSNIDVYNQVQNYLKPKSKPVTQYDQSDVDRLDYDETMKAIASIQSATCRSNYLTEDGNVNEKFNRCKEIESMLLDHKETVKPVEDAYIRKSDLIKVIDAIKTTDADIHHVVELLENLVK